MNIRISQASASANNECLVPAVSLPEWAEETRAPCTSETGFGTFRSWQVRTTLWTGIVGPPIASFVLLPRVLFSNSTIPGHAFDLPTYAIIFLFLAVPAGYVFGAVPALLTGAIYSGALTVIPSLRFHALLRACAGIVSGSLCCGLWFHAAIGDEWPAYASAAALVMGLLALRRPHW